MGRMLGPFKSIAQTGMPSLIISPIGLVPKPDGGFRLIHHLSHPWGQGINAFITDADARVTYARFDDALEYLINFGPGALMAKVDVQSAYRLLPMQPSDYPYLGLQLESDIYIDLMLPMGAKISAAHWERFGHLWEWLILAKTPFPGKICRYLDDLLCCFPTHINASGAQLLLQQILDLCTFIGLPLAPEKLVKPTTRLVFLGLEIDSINQTFKVPAPKLQDSIQSINSMLSRTSCKVRKIQSLAGLLSFLCKALPAGRPFLRRLFDAIKGQPRHHWVHINTGIKQDLQTWLSFLRIYNGLTPFPPLQSLRSTDLHLFTDASLTGYGIVCGTHWAHGLFPPQERLNKSMTWREFFPILVAVTIFCSDLADKKICFVTDNSGVYHIIKSLSSYSSDIMALVRPFILQCLKHNIHFTSSYIPSASNCLADALSRQCFQSFRYNAPDADPLPTPIPGHLTLT